VQAHNSEEADMAAKRIAILGSGAQGSGVGADMIRAGLDVTFIEQWPDHVEAMRQHGVEIRLPEETVVTPVRALHLCEVATLRERFDIVFLVTKAYDTRWACELIKPVLADDGLVVGLQNGMSIDDIASVVGPERTIGAVIEMASNMFEPGVVNRENSPATAWFAVGAFDERTRGREQEVWEALRHAGTVEISDDIRSSKWMKLVANAGELVPSAILGLPLADAAALPGVREFMDRCCREAAEAAVVSGSRLKPVFGLTEADLTDSDTYAPALLDIVLQKFSSPTTRTTVLQDWMKGRRAEVEEINGTVVRAMRAAGRSAPANERTVEIALRIEAGELTNTPENVDLLLAAPVGA
jgi:2-dehydropantoate 2-reductase